MIRNASAFGAALALWVFFFVPNPVFTFLNVQGLNARLPSVVLFEVVPAIVAFLLWLLQAGSRRMKFLSSLAVPTAGIMVCLLLWAARVYSDEDLLGAWGYSLSPIPAFVVGVVVSSMLLRSDVQPGNRESRRT